MTTVRGVNATIHWSYQRAATVQNFIIQRDRDKREWTVEGVIVQANAFALQQAPLTFVVPHSKGVWRWPIKDPIRATAGPFAARLGEVEGTRTHVNPHQSPGNRTP